MTNFQAEIERAKIALAISNGASYASLVTGDRNNQKQRNLDNLNAKLIFEALKEEGRDATDKEKEVLRKYTGMGGLGKGSTDEYYTPQYLVDASIELLGGLDDGDVVLDPSSGTGVFSQSMPDGVSMINVEYNEFTAGLSGMINPEADTVNEPFETASKRIPDGSLDGVITNVPFGSRDKSLDSSKAYSDIDTLEHYFIIKSLEKLKAGKRAVFIVPSSFASNNNTYVKAKLKIARLGSFIGGMKLPNKVFSHTGANVSTDIVIFEKHPDSAVDGMKMPAKFTKESINDSVLFKGGNNEQFIRGTYFKNNKQYVIGKFIPSEQFQQSELFNGFDRKDQTLTTDSVEQIKEKVQKLAKASKFKNDVDYSLLVASENTEVVSEVQLSENSDLWREYLGLSQKLKSSGSLKFADGLRMTDALKTLISIDSIPSVGDISKLDNIFQGIYTLYSTSDRSKAWVENACELAAFFMLNGSAKITNQDAIRLIKDGEMVVKFLTGTSSIKKMSNLGKSDLQKVFSYRVKLAFNELSNLIALTWDTNVNEPLDEESLSSKSFSDLMADKGIGFELLDRDEFGRVILANKGNENFTSAEILASDSLLLVNGHVTSFDDIVFNGAKRADLQRYINELTFNESYGLSEKEFEEKRARIKSSIGLYIKPVSIDKIRITQENVASMFDAKYHTSIAGIKRVLIGDLMRDVLFIDTPKNEQVSGADHIVKNSTLVASFFSKNATASRKKMLKQYPDVMKEAFGLQDLSIYSLQSTIRNLTKQGRVNAYKVLVPVIHKHNAKAIARYSLLLETNVKNNQILADALRDRLERNASVSLLDSDRDRLRTKHVLLDSVVSESVIDSNHPYQNEDIATYSDSLSGIIASDVGLGKTRTMLLTAVSAVMKRKVARALIVVPTAIIDNWKLAATDGEKDSAGNWIVEPIIKDEQKGIVSYITSSNKSDWNALKSSAKVKIVIITADAFKTIKFTAETLAELRGSTQKDIDANQGVVSMPSKIPQFNDKDWANAEIDKNSIGFFEGSGVELMIIDEAQESKNAVTGGKAFKFASALKGSVYGNRVSIISTLLRMHHGGSKGTVFASATPFTSSPYEIYTMLKNSGGLHGIDTLKEFQDIFFTTREAFIEGVIDDSQMVKVELFNGLTNLNYLKDSGMAGVKFRSVDTENIDTIQPESNQELVAIKSNDSIKVAKTEIVAVYNTARDIVKSLSDDPIDPGGDGRVDVALSVLGLDITTDNGMRELERASSSFNALDKLGKLAINSDFAKGQMTFNLGSIDEEGRKGILDSLLKKSIKGTEIVVVQDKKDASFYEKEVKIDIKLSDINSKKPLMVDGVLTIPAVDNALAGFIFKEAEKLTSDPILDINEYPKYAALVENIEAELKKDSNSKQIIFTLSLAGAKFIEHFVKRGLRESGIKSSLILNSTDIPKKSTDEGEVGAKAQFQQKYNNENSKPVILIFTKAYSKGVNFNINTKAIHLVDVPLSPDVDHQATGRGLRQGNTTKVVNVFRYLQDGTIDKSKSSLVAEKSEWQSEVLKKDGNTISTVSVSAEQVLVKALQRFGADFTDDDVAKIKGEEESKIQAAMDEEDEVQNQAIFRFASDSLDIAEHVARVGGESIMQREVSKVYPYGSSGARQVATMFSIEPPNNNLKVTEVLKSSGASALGAMIVDSIRNTIVFDDFKGKSFKEVVDMVNSIPDGLATNNDYGHSSRKVTRYLSVFASREGDEDIDVEEVQAIVREISDSAKEGFAQVIHKYSNPEEYKERALRNVIANSSDEADKVIAKGLLDGSLVQLNNEFVNRDEVADVYELPYASGNVNVDEYFKFGTMLVSIRGTRTAIENNGIYGASVKTGRSILKSSYTYEAAEKTYNRKKAKQDELSEKYFNGKGVSIESYDGSIKDIIELIALERVTGLSGLVYANRSIINDFSLMTNGSQPVISFNAGDSIYHSKDDDDRFIEAMKLGADRATSAVIKDGIKRDISFIELGETPVSGVLTSESDMSLFEAEMFTDLNDTVKEAVSAGLELDFPCMFDSKGRAMCLPYGQAERFLSLKQEERERQKRLDELGESGAYSYPVTQLKEFFVGSGESDKKEIVAEILDGKYEALSGFAKMYSERNSERFWDSPSWINDEPEFLITDDLDMIVVNLKFDKSFIGRNDRWSGLGVYYSKDKRTGLGTNGSVTVENSWQVSNDADFLDMI